LERQIPGETQNASPWASGLREDAFMFDPLSMRDERADVEDDPEQEQKQQLVDIVVTPALFKRGNANGERFDCEVVAEKAVVVLYRP
jgi:hypothetical protein